MPSFANPWGLLALLAVPAIIAIHLYRRRFPRLAVAGAFLWGGETEVRDAGRTRDRLPITATLILEVLAAALLVLILAQPRFGGAGRVEHLVVVLDDSASMTAKPRDEATIRDAVVAELEKRLEALGRNAVVTVVTTGRRPALLVGPAARWDDAKERLKNWRPRATDHDPAPAWDLAAQLAGEDGRLLFLTDRSPADDASLPPKMESVALGRPASNIALTAARWRFDPSAGRGTIALRVERFGPSSEPVTLTGTAAGKSVFSRQITVPDGESVPVEFAVPGGLGTLTIGTDSPDDALPLDSTIMLVEPKRRTVRVAVTLPEDHAAVRPLRRVLEQLPAVEFSPAEQADLVIALGGTLPEANPELWWLGVGPFDDSDDAKTVDLAGPYVIDKRDLLTDAVVLGGVVWGGVQEVSLTVSPLISTGPYPLFSRLDGTPTKAYLLNIDMAQSNLADSPDWPILVANLVAAVRDDQPGLRRWNYRSGETVTLRLPPAAEQGGATLTLTGPDGDRPVARAQTVEITPPATPGVYVLRDGETPIAEFAVNFQDDTESDLTTRRSGHREPSTTVTARGVTPDTIYSWPILAAIACVIGAVVADWYVLRRNRKGGYVGRTARDSREQM
ncbi:MAG: BatA and WFA domain-containing protein [Planctomycetaceae bacterium]